MKNCIIFIALIVLNSKIEGQLIGGHEKGNRVPTIVKPEESFKSVSDGDVDLFTGAYQHSIDLGTVSTPTGTKFNLKLSHSSSGTTSSYLTTESSIPYGEGWSLNLPYIKFYYTQQSWQNNGIPYCEEDLAKWYIDNLQGISLTIPGVYSGEMVFKYFSTTHKAIFVPKQLEKYIEMELYVSDMYPYANGYAIANPSAIVRTGDGTHYVFNACDYTYLNPPNTLLNGPNTGKTGASIIPIYRTEGIKISNIYNPNLSELERIVFNWEAKGKINHFEEFTQPLENSEKNFVSPSEVILKSIDALDEYYGHVIQKLELNYKLDSLYKSKIDTNASYFYDDMYIARTIWASGTGQQTSLVSQKLDKNLNTGFTTWAQWNVIKHAAYTNKNTSGWSNTLNNWSDYNPYEFAPNSYTKYQAIHTNDNNANILNHSYIEKTGIDPSLFQRGQMYQIKSYIYSNYQDLQLEQGPLIDIDLAYSSYSNFHNKSINDGIWNVTSPPANSYGKIFTTFNRPMKWRVLTEGNKWNRSTGEQYNNYTSNYFIMPHYVGNYNTEIPDLILSMGPSNSDNIMNLTYCNTTGGYNIHFSTLLKDCYYSTYHGEMYRKNPTSNWKGGGNYPFNCHNSCLPCIHSSISQNFGVGLPWQMTLDKYFPYNNNNSNSRNLEMFGFGHCVPSALTCAMGIQPPFATNKPTKAENIRIQRIEINLIEKMPLMLKSAILYDFNNSVRLNTYITPLIYRDQSNGGLIVSEGNIISIKELNYSPKAMYNRKSIAEAQAGGNAGGNMVIKYTLASIDHKSIVNAERIRDSFEYSIIRVLDYINAPHCSNYNNYNCEILSISKVRNSLGLIKDIKYKDGGFFQAIKEGVSQFKSCVDSILLYPAVTNIANSEIKTTKYIFSNPQNKSSLFLTPFVLEMGFRNAMIYHTLNPLTNKRKYSTYEFFNCNNCTYGNAISSSTSFKTSTLFFGKLIKEKHYNEDNILLKETENEYDFQIAFKNGLNRDIFVNYCSYQDCGGDCVTSENTMGMYIDFNSANSSNGKNLFQFTQSRNNHSYFLFLKKKTDKEIFNDKAGTNQTNTQIEEYEYYEGDSIGNYKNEGQKIVDSPIYKYYGKLHTEPSWNLYKTTKYSPLNPKFKLTTEYFYLHNFLNTEFNCYPPPKGPHNDEYRELPTYDDQYYTCGFYNLVRQHKLFNLLSEIRTTYYNEGEDPLRKSIYYKYSVTSKPGIALPNTLDNDSKKVYDSVLFKIKCQTYTHSDSVRYFDSIEMSKYPSGCIYIDPIQFKYNGWSGQGQTGEYWSDWEIHRTYYTSNPCTIRRWNSYLSKWVKCPCSGFYDKKWWAFFLPIGYVLDNTKLYIDISTLTSDANTFYPAVPPKIVNSSSNSFPSDISEGKIDLRTRIIDMDQIRANLSSPNSTIPALIKVPHRNTLFTINGYILEDSTEQGIARFENSIYKNVLANIFKNYQKIKNNYPSSNILEYSDWVQDKSLEEVVDFFYGDSGSNHNSEEDVEDSSILEPITYQYCPHLECLLFKSEHEKIDDVVIYDQIAGKYDNKYQIARPARDTVMIPFHNILKRAIVDRTYYLLTDKEVDGKGLLTKYYYGYFSETNLCNSKKCYGIGGQVIINPICTQAMRYNNLYLPIRITTGYERPDSIGINLYYNDNATLSRTLSDQGANIIYTYDGFNRLISTNKNGNMLTLNDYHLWDRAPKSSLLDIANQNYIETRTFFERNSTRGLIARSYIDPFGRKQGTITFPVTDVNAAILPTTDYSGIMTGESILDYEDKVIKQYKPFEFNKNPIRIYKNTNAGTSFPTEHQNFEYDFKSQLSKSFDYDIPTSSSHYSKSETTLETGTTMQSELSLNGLEQTLLRYSASEKYFRTETRDPDNKKTYSYSYLNGKKLADVVSMGSGNSPLITLYAYDDKWDLRKVIDPSKLETNYRSNLQGLVFFKEAPDMGVSKFYYDEVGSLVAMQDRKLWYEHNAKIRVFTYDHFGRMLMQVRGQYDMDKLCPKCTKGIGIGNNGDETNYDYRPRDPKQYLASLYELRRDISLPNSNTTIYSNTYGQSYYWLPNMNVLEDSIEGIRSIFDSLTNITVEKHFVYNDLDEKYIDNTERHPNLNIVYKAQLADIKSTIPSSIESGISSWNKWSLGKLSVATSYDEDGNIHEINSKRYNYMEYLYEDYYYAKFKNYSPAHFIKHYVNHNFLSMPEAIVLRKFTPTGSVMRTLNGINNRYDEYGNLGAQDYTTTNATWSNLADYTYDRPTGRLSMVNYSALNPNIQVNYIYDKRNRLETIDGTVFKEDLFYDNNFPSASIGANKANYNGNINGVETKFTSCTPVPSHFNQTMTYKYSYDPANRLQSATADAKINSSSPFGSQTYSYLPNGNIQNYGSQDYSATVSGNSTWNNYFYNYNYGTNQVNRIAPTANFTSPPSPIAQNDRTFYYDKNGNLSIDNFRATTLSHGRANLPHQIVKNGTTQYYGYNTSDARIFKGNTQQASYYIPGTGVYDFVRDTWEFYIGGIAQIKDDRLSYLVKDHLSNTRAIIDVSDGCNGASAISAYDYYPFGKILRKYESVTSRYQSTEHETDAETGYNDRGARLYDDEALNFIQNDPHADKYPSLSPYSYVARNPIILVDKNGKDINLFSVNSMTNTGQPIYDRNLMPHNAAMAFKDYTNTDFGKNQLLDFAKRDNVTYFGSLKAQEDGRFSKYDLNISVSNLKDPSERGAFMMGRNGLFFPQEVDGKLTINVYIDAVGRSKEYIGEKIAHEMALHGSDIQQIIKLYEKGGMKAVDAFMSQNPNGDKDHKQLLNPNSTDDGLKNYIETMDELQEIDKDYNDVRKQAMDDYKQRYAK